MRICIVGAGAIGQVVGTKLALGGAEVVYLARGETLAAINSLGTRVVRDGREEVATSVRAEAEPGAVGPCDVVVLAVKSHQVAAIAPTLAPLFHAKTLVVPMQNGVPFWYFHEHGGPHAGRIVEAVDPGGACMRAVPADRIIGCVVYAAGERSAPSTVQYAGPGRFPIGELDGRTSDRIQALAAAFVAGGFEAPVVEDIRAEVWVKLWGNVSFNPISALTRATLQDICADPDGRELTAQMMREAQAVGEKLGVRFRVTLEKRIEGAARVGRHKTSMLQDTEAGRALEVEALVGAVVELGAIAGVPTPTITAVYRSTKLLDRMLAAGAFSARAAEMPSG
jgi:2-dehydropantoate 2-reductase